ncbi:MAG TPA: aldehyde dehydrogenase (NADP(+)), partial [Pedobacter sp.]
LEGQLTITIMAAKDELKNHKDFLSKLTDKTGRLILNGVPTGVEVCAAMQHGGPFPATNDNRFTSVGASAIYRFVRPVAWQDWDPELLPEELKDGNPLNIFRLTDNSWSK